MFSARPRPSRVAYAVMGTVTYLGLKLVSTQLLCFEPGMTYLDGSLAGPQIVLNGGAVTVKAKPLRGRLQAEH